METRRMKKLREVRESTMNSPTHQGQSDEEDETTKRKNEAMQRVFEIPLMVEEIIYCLPFPDLKKSRLVCSMWKETATKIILKKDCSQVKIIYDYQLGKFQKEFHDSLSPEIPLQYLTELTQIVQKSSTFPSSNFIINHGNFGDSEMLEFFKAGGEGVKTLKMNSRIAIFFRDWRKILEVYCPNLETLRLNLPNFDKTSSIQLDLPKLKLFSAGFYSGFRFRNIIAPNLEEIELFDLVYDTKDLLKAGKIHTVKDLYLCDCPQHSPANLVQDFVNGGPQVEKLTFFYEKRKRADENWTRDFIAAFQQLLDASRDTLKFLKFGQLEYMFRNLNFPRFSQLKEIIISEYDKPERIFPIRINLSGTFPNLEILDVSQCHFSEDSFWDKYFPPPDAYSGQLTSVTEVRVHGCCTPKCREMFRLMCPNAVIVDC